MKYCPRRHSLLHQLQFHQVSHLSQALTAYNLTGCFLDSVESVIKDQKYWLSRSPLGYLKMLLCSLTLIVFASPYPNQVSSFCATVAFATFDWNLHWGTQIIAFEDSTATYFPSWLSIVVAGYLRCLLRKSSSSEWQFSCYSMYFVPSDWLASRVTTKDSPWE